MSRARPSGSCRSTRGSGDLIAGALQGRFDVAKSEEHPTETEDPRRLQVVCYTDHAAYSRPVPGLLNLQTSLRLRESRGGAATSRPSH